MQRYLLSKEDKLHSGSKAVPERDLLFRFDPNNADARLTYLLLESAFLKQKSLNRKTEVLPLTTIGICYVDFLIPGLMAISIMNACLWGIGWNLIELRIKKLLRRMVATPLKKSVFLLSHGFEPHVYQCRRTAFALRFCTLLF